MLRLKQTIEPEYFTSNEVCPAWAISVLMKYFYQSLLPVVETWKNSALNC